MEAGPYIVRLTNYATNKIAAVRAGLEEVPFGTGPGNFNDYVGSLKPIGLYPDYFINFDPHCTYTGAFGELGFPGLFALLWVIIAISRALFKTSSPGNQQTLLLHLGLSGCFLFIAMDAMILDTLHFRYIWILLGILAYLVEMKKQEEQGRPVQPGIISQTTS
jgi:O-antigen ligase